MTPKTQPYILLRPCLGHQPGDMLPGYLWPRRGLELMSNGRREFVEPGTAEPYVRPVVDTPKDES